MCDEISGGENRTPHTHVFLLCSSPVRFSTIQRRFSSGEDQKPYGHVESAYGSAFSNRQYLLKEGKWKQTKGDTSVEGTFEEFGQIPSNENTSKRGEAQFIFDMVESGFSTAEILRMHPEVLPYLEKIDKVRQILLEEQYKNTFRILEVVYIYGRTGLGKSRAVMEKEGYVNTYRFTDYSHRGWDKYRNQRTVCFEEFHSNFPIQNMLIMLDGYPLDLPARFHQKTACYEKVYITSNIPLIKQYENVQREEPDVWQAFLRRINKVKHYLDNGIIKEYTVKEYLEMERDAKFYPVVDKEKNPFE
ncbi:MAG: replication protein [Eubacteriales bacterium]|nr:replication protein [Eubacteriales bacterium]